MYRVAKSVADALVRRIAQALPAWKRFTIERTFAARETYQPSPPANLAMMPSAMAKRFLEPVHFSTHHLYRLRNVHVTWDGAVFHNLRLFVPSIVQSRFVSRFQDTLLLRQWVGGKVESPQCLAVCHDQWSVENYYHWLIDTLPRLLVLRQSYPDMLLLLPQPLPPKQLPEYISKSAAALGFSHYLPLTSRQIVHADCLILPELTTASLTQNPDTIQQVRTELIAALAPKSERATRKVYATRSNAGVRKIHNGADVEALLDELGFEKVYFEQLSFLGQINLMQETAVFVGIHGAGMTNMLFLQKEAKVVELLNKQYGDLCYFRLASCLGLSYFCLPCTGKDNELANQSDMTVDIEMLEKVLTAASQ